MTAASACDDQTVDGELGFRDPYRTRIALHQLVEAQVVRTPHATAVVSDQQQLTYESLDWRANHLARALIASGAGAGRPVGVLTDRSVDMVVAVLGILKAGSAYVP